MPGNRHLLDTNALVALLQGHQGLLALTENSQWLGVSVINVLEFLGFDGLLEADRALFLELVVITNNAVLLKLGTTASKYTAQAF